jgi:hypothetical protein
MGGGIRCGCIWWLDAIRGDLGYYLIVNCNTQERLIHMRARTRLIRVTQASEYLGLSPNTLRNWVRAGLVPVLKSPTKRWFWTRELLDEIRNNMIDEGNNHVANASTPGTPNAVDF